MGNDEKRSFCFFDRLDRVFEGISD